MGRSVLGYNEMVRIGTAEKIVRAYQMKANSDDWVKWARNNPDEAKLLAETEKMIAEKEILEDG